MTVHRILVVEDDASNAEELAGVARSLDCEPTVCDNAQDAVRLLADQSYCLVLLDLQIKGSPGSIKGNTRHGIAVLQYVRKNHGGPRGASFWLPVIVVSGHAREPDEAVDLMKEGADDVIQKPFKAANFSKAIQDSLRQCGRESHQQCVDHHASANNSAEPPLVLAIPGETKGRRTRITIGLRSAFIPDESLRILLQLMIAHVDRRHIHSTDLGARPHQGFKGISRLRDALKPALGEEEGIIQNHYYGNYSLNAEVSIGEVNTQALTARGDAGIAKLASELADRIRGKSRV